MSQERVTSIQRFKRLVNGLQIQIKSEAVDQLNIEADQLVDQMRAAAPEKSGNLKRSIRKEKGNKETRVFVKAGGRLTTRAIAGRKERYERDVLIGSGDTKGIAKVEGGSGRVVYDYANAIEFGTKDEAAQPFFWPSWRLRRKRIRSSMKRRITKNIKAKSAG